MIRRYTLRLKGPFVTDWASDTLFGALCWMCVLRHGEATLAGMLDLCREGRPPFVVSSAFPGLLLPRPLIPIEIHDKTALTLDSMQSAKKLKKAKWLDVASFDLARQGLPYSPADLRPPFRAEVSLHNQIDRRTGRTGETGQLYEQEEMHLDTAVADCLTLYALMEPGWRDVFETALADLGNSGVGKRASTGKGAFTVESSEEFAFGPVEGPNGYVVLGNVVPGTDVSVKGFYRIAVRRGRLGLDYSKLGNPFKKPLTVLVSGSAFYHQGDIPAYVGSLVDGLAPSLPHVVHGAITLAVPAKLPAVHP